MKYVEILDGVVRYVGTADTLPLLGYPLSVVDITDLDPQPQEGWLYDGVTFTTPPHTPPPELPKVTFVSPVQFKLLFTPQERVALKTAKQVDPILEDFYDLVDDPRLTGVDLTLTSTNMAVSYILALLHTEGVVTDIAARKAQILSGVVQ